MTWKPDVCLHHHPCHDGFAAAWAVWKRWPDCVFVGVNYGQPPPMVECEGKNVLIVDFSYPPDSLRALGMTAKDVVVLDHHKTAQDDLAEFIVTPPEGLTHETAEEIVHGAVHVAGGWPIIAEFDMDRSGARMAWEFCHPGEPVPDLIRFIEDRDLWRFNFDMTRPLHFLLSTVPMDFVEWDMIMDLFEGQKGLCISKAVAIEAYHDQKIADAAKAAGRIDLAGFNVPIANAPPFMASDLGNLLAEGEPFAVIWWEHTSDEQDKVTYSLRSKPNGEDVSEIAKLYGGGGHARAAGFKVRASAIKAFAWERAPEAAE